MINIGPLYFFESKRAFDIVKSDCFDLITSLELTRLSLKGINAWQHWLPCNFQFGSLVYAAKYKNELLGLMSISRHDKFYDCWKIEHIVISPKHQRQGIASEFLNFIRAIYSSQGVRAFTCEVNVNNSQALNLFASKGFKNLFMVNYLKPTETFFEVVDNNNRKNFKKAKSSQIASIVELYEISLPFKAKEAFGILNNNDYSLVQTLLNKVYFRTQALTNIWTYSIQDRLIGCLDISIVNNIVIVEYCLHPGYQDSAPDLVKDSIVLLNSLFSQNTKFLFKIFDYQPAIEDALKSYKVSIEKSNCYLIQEHWSRVTKSQSIVSPISIQKKVKPI